MGKLISVLLLLSDRSFPSKLYTPFIMLSLCSQHEAIQPEKQNGPMTLGMIVYNIKQLFLFLWLPYIGGVQSNKVHKYPKKYTKLPRSWNDESSSRSGQQKMMQRAGPIKSHIRTQVRGYTFTKLFVTLFRLYISKTFPKQIKRWSTFFCFDIRGASFQLLKTATFAKITPKQWFHVCFVRLTLLGVFQTVLVPFSGLNGPKLAQFLDTQVWLAHTPEHITGMTHI